MIWRMLEPGCRVVWMKRHMVNGVHRGYRPKDPTYVISQRPVGLQVCMESRLEVQRRYSYLSEPLFPAGFSFYFNKNRDTMRFHRTFYFADDIRNSISSLIFTVNEVKQIFNDVFVHAGERNRGKIYQLPLHLKTLNIMYHNTTLKRKEIVDVTYQQPWKNNKVKELRKEMEELYAAAKVAPLFYKMPTFKINIVKAC
jgi:hypothetical protein